MGQRCAKASLARWGSLATVGLIAVSLAGAAQSFGQALRPDAVFTISGRVLLLAADGNSAAVTTEVKRACARRIVVWTAPERRSTSVKPGILGCSGDGISRLAVGGGRVAWIEQGGGNNLEMSLMTASLGGRTMKQLEFVTNGDRAGADPAGDWVGQLFGAGSLLAYNSWTQVCDKPADQECGEKDPRLRLTNQKLVRIASGRRVVVTRGTDAYPLTAVGGGRHARRRKADQGRALLCVQHAQHLAAGPDRVRADGQAARTFLGARSRRRPGGRPGFARTSV